MWKLTFDGYSEVGTCAVDVDECAEDDAHCDLCASEDFAEEVYKLCAFFDVDGCTAGVVFRRTRGSTETIFNCIADTIYQVVYEAQSTNR